MKDWQRKYPDRRKLFEGLLQGATTIDERTRLAHCVVDLAVVMTQWIVHRRHYSLRMVEMTIRDLAHDAVAELLAEGHAVAGTPLRKAMEIVEQSRSHQPIADAVEMAVAKTRRWALDAYVRKGKLSHVEMEGIMQAIREYALDLSEDQAESHFFYLHRHLAGLTYERFRSEFRNVFQYVLKAFFTNGSGLLVFDTVSIKDKS